MSKQIVYREATQEDCQRLGVGYNPEGHVRVFAEKMTIKTGWLGGTKIKGTGHYEWVQRSEIARSNLLTGNY